MKVLLINSMPEDTLSDTILVKQVCDGDRKAFGRLYEKYKEPLFRFCLRLLKNSEQAEDTVQETFFRVWTKASAIDNPHSFRAWLFSVARFHALNNLRDRKEGQEISENDLVELDTPHEIVVRAEQTAGIMGLIELLNPQHRELILLRSFEEFSYAEISMITGLSLSSVKVQLFNARKVLTQLHSKHQGEKPT